MFRFSLRTLFIVVTLAAVASYVGYLVMRPYLLIARVDCGNGRWIELLEPNGFCDQGGPVLFRFWGMKSAEPQYFATWGCSERPPAKLISAEDGDLVALAFYPPDELRIVVDFGSGLFWPHGDGFEVDDNARNMLGRLRREHGDLRLWGTSEAELTKADFSE